MPKSPQKAATKPAAAEKPVPADKAAAKGTGKGDVARLGITGSRSGTHLKTGMGGLYGVPVERRCAIDAIRLHDPELN